MITWEDNNDESNDNVRRVRSAGGGSLHHTDRNRRGRGQALILPSPAVLAARILVTLAGITAAFCALMTVLSLALDTPEEHREPTRAEALGIGGGL